MICSANSFLYAFNDWCDINWYLSLGNGILNDMVIYKDLFDHKGPLVYFFCAFCQIFNNPYIVVWVFEVLCLLLTMILSYRYSKKYINIYLSMFVSVLFAFLFCTSSTFHYGGGAVEEWLMPIFAFYLLTFDETFLGFKEVKKLKAFFLGLFLGIIFWVKFSLVIFPAIYFLIYLILKIVRREYKELIRTILFSVLGFTIVCFFILLYFVVNKALIDLWNHYFYDNIFRYAGQRYVNFFNIIVTMLKKDAIIYGVIFSGLICSFFTLRKKQLYFGLSFLLSLVIMFFLSDYGYYYLWLTIFCVYSFTHIFLLFVKIKIKQVFILSFATIISTSCFVMIFFVANPIKNISKSKEDYIQFQIKNYIEIKSEDKSIYCYKMVDYGFYNVLDESPKDKYYALSAFYESVYPEMYEGFSSAIVNKKSKWVLVLKEIYNQEKTFLDTYYKVDKDFSDFTLMIRK